MALSWNEIKDRALKFSKDFANATRENAETQTFYNEFFNIFGISRRRIASFEEPVKKLGTNRGRIDLFWKGELLVEQKSEGKNLKKAKEQALNYFPNLKEEELPKYILVSDFQHFELFDLDTGEETKFLLKDLHKNVKSFAFIAGYKPKSYKDVEPASIKAAELMGELYDQLRLSGYPEHDLELFLTRILFCLFADDAGIWEKDILTQYIEERTAPDGSDLGAKLAHFFQILNTPPERRSNNLDEHLSRFAYINGSLFDMKVEIPDFNNKMRESFLKCCYYNWSNVSPAIFGSLFQSVSDPEKRRSLGEHYTSEKNIMKLIEPLFLEDLNQEFEYLMTLKNNKSRLEDFHNKLASLKFLDPACGCGNFLVISYRELRRLEIKVLLAINEIERRRANTRDEVTRQQSFLSVLNISKIDVDNFYGIEIEEFPAKIAEVAMWMTDHLMNIELSEAFGQYFARIPLKKSAKIVNANSLSIDWNEIIRPESLNYILGNPPFIGKHLQSKEQTIDLTKIFFGVKGIGVLDYVTAWYLKSAQYIKNYSHIKCAFVSTNSITQGEQIGVLWNELLKNYNIKIHFAHRTFDWCNEARGNAHVHCVIIGFANFDTSKKRLFDYDDIKGEPHEIEVKNINPYLVEYNDFVILKKTKPICDVPEMIFGSKPVDNGNFLFTNDEKAEFISKEPNANKYFRPILSSREFLNGENRWCLWLSEISPNDLKSMPLVLNRVNNVKQFRLNSTKLPTIDAAKTPSLFAEIRHKESDLLLIPRHSSENRKYIPFGFFSKDFIVSDSCMMIPDATPYDFGVLTSEMHMTWMKYVCGRIKSDYRYSNSIVYNNYPFPNNLSDKNKQNVEQRAQTVLKIRAKYTDCSLAVLYNPETMPPDLMKAHQELDKAVDKCYCKTSFKSERERIEFLFALYEQYAKPLLK